HHRGPHPARAARRRLPPARRRPDPAAQPPDLRPRRRRHSVRGDQGDRRFAARGAPRMKNHILVSLKMTAVLVILTCGLYPLVVFAAAQLLFPSKANGSFVEWHGRVAGSELIGQSFTSERFFHPRPSASDYDATASGGTNLGPTSKKLRDAIAQRTG